MSKYIYDNRVDEILDNLKERILNEKFEDHINGFVNNYEKMANLRIRTIEISQKRNNEIFHKLEKDLEYYKNQEHDLAFMANESEAHKEYKAIVKYLENFLREVSNGIK